MAGANVGHNLTALKKDIIEGLAAQGIPRKALVIGEQMQALDEDVRNAILAALPIVLEAIGAPIDDQLPLIVPEDKE